MEEKPKIYTATDFQNYHAGTMPAHEMHLLERAALKDPFLADALEGFSQVSSPEQDVAALQERLQKRRVKRKVMTITPLWEKRWWHVAAVFIVVLGIGYFLFRPARISNQNQLAKNINKASQEKTVSPPVILADSAGPANDVAFSQPDPSPLKKENETALPNDNTTLKREESSPQLQARSYKDVASKDKTGNDSRANILFRNSTAKTRRADNYLLKGRVVDEYGAPVSNAVIKGKNNIGNSTVDENSTFSFPSPDSRATVLASAPGFDSTEFLLENDRESVLVLKREERHGREDVARHGAENKPEQTLASKAIERNASGVETKKREIEPFPPNEKFNAYLRENRKPVYDSNNQPVSGGVILSFTITKNGRPGQIKILASTCKECEGQAIRLIQSGPDWTGTQTRIGTVNIRFD